MKYKYIVSHKELSQTATSAATLESLIKEILSWGAKLGDIKITLAWETESQHD